MEKYKRQEVSPVEEENERDESYQSTNPNIDSSRTKENYHIIHPYKSYIEIINRRLSQLELKRKIRSDAILMNSFVVTSDGEFFKGLRPWEQQDFFRDCVQFFEDKYGTKNMISAVVHMDETTPHLHLNFVPINDGRLSSKSLFDRQKLAQLQTELWEQVGKKYGLQRGKSGSAATHVSAAEHRAKRIVEEAEQRGAEIDEQTTKKKAELANLTQTIDTVTEAQNQPISKKKHEVEREIKTLRTANAAYAERLRIKNADSSYIFGQLQEATRARDKMQPTYDMATEIMSVYPDEFQELLQRARTKKNLPTPFKRNSNGSGKGGK
ncbi:MAG: plasmid recombination protein [Clostridia bacterium]|nr:plasmid recombination protein [Clostridia bacterium]